MLASQPSARRMDVEFALIGHQESWDRIARMVHELRNPGLPPLPDSELREIIPWIPARTVIRSRVASTEPGRSTPGIYVETFIAPEELETGRFHRAVAKVRDAVACAAREGARVAALGGFTSIVVEGHIEAAGRAPTLALTTGNTLAAAFVVQGVQRAAALLSIDLRHATLLVVGSTGDVGSACAQYLAPMVKRLLLGARNAERLRRQQETFRRAGVDAAACSDVGEALTRADVVIAAASLAQPGFDLDACHPDVLVCDAGYPKNLRAATGVTRRRVFWGGMGRALGGWSQEGGLRLEAVYGFPAGCVAHGCLLEAVVLALARRFEPFSQGRGRITPERMDEIASLAAAHGVVLAPLFGADGIWPEDDAAAPGRPA